ncbi:dna ligase 1-like [Nannochloropsis oceanica]
MGGDSKVSVVVKKEEKEGTEMIHLTKPGQKYTTPTPGVPERIFYESLYEQNPESFMAQEYCVQYGILEEDEAMKIFKRVQARKAKGAIYSPSPVKKSTAAAAAKKGGVGGAKKKKRRLDDDAPVDTGLMEGGVEGVGSMSFA